MTVSVVIPTWNGRPHLMRCLESMARQTVAPAEIIVVDNGSSDGTGDWLAAQGPRVRTVRLPRNVGFAGGVNRGADGIVGDILWILNDDVVVDPRCLEELLAALVRRPDQAACSAKILRLGSDGPALPARYDAVGDYLTWTGFLYHLGFDEEDQGQYDGVQELFSPKGVSFVIRKADFDAMGRFDESFGSYFEESDLFWRLWLAGRRVGFAPSARVWHEGGVTARRIASPTIDYQAFRNRLRTLLTHLGRLRLALILPVHLAGCAGVIGLYMARGRWRNACAVATGVGAALMGGPAVRAKRRRVQHVLRVVTDRALFGRHARAWPWRDGRRFLRAYLARW